MAPKLDWHWQHFKSRSTFLLISESLRLLASFCLELVLRDCQWDNIRRRSITHYWLPVRASDRANKVRVVHGLQFGMKPNLVSIPSLVSCSQPMMLAHRQLAKRHSRYWIHLSTCTGYCTCHWRWLNSQQPWVFEIHMLLILTQATVFTICDLMDESGAIHGAISLMCKLWYRLCPSTVMS